MAIYALKNKNNNMVYIGQTTQKDPYRRIRYHFCNKKTRYRSEIRNAVLEHGEDSFEIIILNETVDKDQLNQLEKYYIEMYNSMYPNGYNLQYGGQKNKFTKETKLKMSKRQKGVPARGKGKKGHKKSLELRKKMSLLRRGFTSPNRKKAAKESAKLRMKKVLATNIQTGEVTIFDSVTEAGRVLDVKAYNISRVCNGVQNRKQAGGYRFTFI